MYGEYMREFLGKEVPDQEFPRVNDTSPFGNSLKLNFYRCILFVSLFSKFLSRVSALREWKEQNRAIEEV